MVTRSWRARRRREARTRRSVTNKLLNYPQSNNSHRCGEKKQSIYRRRIFLNTSILSQRQFPRNNSGVGLIGNEEKQRLLFPFPPTKNEACPPSRPRSARSFTCVFIACNSLLSFPLFLAPKSHYLKLSQPMLFPSKVFSSDEQSSPSSSSY